MPSTAPAIPPRPSRSPRPGLSAPSADVPKIPPRPSNRRLERSTSPGRDSFAPSPLNETPSSARPQSQNDSSSNLPSRPTSVTLPSLGREGTEYEDLDSRTTLDSQSQVQDPPVEQKRDIGSDVKLHAPKPSLPLSTAQAKVHAVTHTNSQQAAAVGFGTAVSPSQGQPDFDNRPLPSETNDSRTASTAPSIERRASIQREEEQGIPEIGQQVPMYPNAGDVQAPSAPPHPSAPTSSAGTRSGRQHHRTRSGREISLPPGSYGLHGHGVQPNDKFEKAWYDKHPDELAREEQGQYGPGLSGERAESALSSDELNRIVRDSASRGAGLGTSSSAVATPEEELGYIASEEYASRLASPNQRDPHLEKTQSKDAQVAAESPLRKSSFPTNETAREDEQLKRSSEISNEGAIPREKEDVIHIDEPHHHQHHPDGFAPAAEDYNQHGAHMNSQDEWSRETGDDVPVLASDEVEPGAEHMQPAISPTFERKEDGYFEKEQEASRSASSSRLEGRPASTHSNVPVRARLNSRGEENDEIQTPLEDVEEYEPLFPEDEKKENEPLSATDRFKQRPEHMKHRFPSQDIWEDAPNSLQLHTTVSTPDVPSRPEVEGSSSSYESPDQEVARKEATEKEDTEKLASQIQESKSHFNDEVTQRRFPSKDVWEDAPESHQLVATVQTPEPEETESPIDSVPSKPAIPPRPTANKVGEQSQDTTPAPSIPSRPQKRVLKAPPFDAQAKPPLQPGVSSTSRTTVSPTEPRKAPVLPDRPKPQIPARPPRPVARDSSESLTKVNSAGSADSGEASKNAPAAPPLKPKPAVPSKPGGSKIAALKAGFLSDLDKRLQLGPMGPKPEKKEEPEAPVEKAPLSDARKGRARGPARRKPAVTAVPKAEPAPTKPAAPEIKMTGSWSVWQVNEEGAVVVGDIEKAEKTPERSSSTTSSIKNTADDIVDSTSPEASEDKASPVNDSPTKDSPVDDVTPDSEDIKPSTDVAPKADDSESSSITSNAEDPIPKEPVNESDEDKTKKEEQLQPEPEPESGDTEEVKNKSPSLPTASIEGQNPEEETITDKELEHMTASADGKKSSDGSLNFEG